MSSALPLPAAQALSLAELIVGTPHGIASRVLARAGGGNLTLFAFDEGQELSEHSTPYDALVLVLEGGLHLTMGGEAVAAGPGTITRMPATVPHAVQALEPSRMLLLMLK
jgi:quercetin dioxygenase-like cupin family protein